MTRILVAGVGNIFCGDDGYGVEVSGRLLSRQRHESVDVRDFGIRGLDLAYALTEGYDAAIIIDAAARGLEPGAISVIEPEIAEIKNGAQPAFFESAHELDPEKVLRQAAALGDGCNRVLFVVCEPFTLGGEEGKMGLSDVVAASVDPCVRLVEELVSSLLLGGEMAPIS